MGLLNPKKSVFCTKKGVLFGQIVSEKGVFFTLGNADTSYLVHMSAGTERPIGYRLPIKKQGHTHEHTPLRSDNKVMSKEYRQSVGPV